MVEKKKKDYVNDSKTKEKKEECIEFMKEIGWVTSDQDIPYQYRPKPEYNNYKGNKYNSSYNSNYNYQRKPYKKNYNSRNYDNESSNNRQGDYKQSNQKKNNKESYRQNSDNYYPKYQKHKN